MSAPELTKADLDAIACKLADEGKLIAAGFAGMRLAIVPPGSTPAQVEAMEVAFLGGAQHLWASMMGILDPGTEPTPADMRRMDLIAREMADFYDRFKARQMKGAH